MTLQALGNLIGGSSYMGFCPFCGSQHMSTHDRVMVNPSAPWQFICAKCAESEPDSRLDEPRAHLVELADPADMEDDLRERSENISLAREDAYERGQDAYTRDGDRDAMAAVYYDHPRLRTDFCDGWEDAKTESGDDQGPHPDARVRQALGYATGVDNQPS